MIRIQLYDALVLGLGLGVIAALAALSFGWTAGGPWA